MADESLKREIDKLYNYYFGRAITGCKNCYADALIELCSISKTNAMNKTEIFVVKRGKVLKDTVSNDARLNLVRGNETEELALYHLYTNPNSRQLFEKLPDDDRLGEMLAEYGEKFETERNAKHGNGTGMTAADKVLNDAMDKAEEVRAEAVQIIETAKAEAVQIIETAKAEAAEIIAEAKKAATTRKATAVKPKQGDGDPILD